MKTIGFIVVLCIGLLSCSKDEMTNPTGTSEAPSFDFKVLALGDSYTKGQGVCSSCHFPRQLLDSLSDSTGKNGLVQLVAQTGWTTTQLINELERVQPDTDHDMVTLLIGVNNQFRGLPITTYESEFEILLDKAIRHAGNDPRRVMVLSIPDYVFTPFGQTLSNPTEVSEEIDTYNDIARSAAGLRNVHFENITDITRLGLEQPELVAADGLHLSALGYEKIVARIYNRAQWVINQ